MKILLLTFYYPPDLSAGSYRAAALVDALVRAGGASLQIDVLTSCPHRYASYRHAAAAEPGISADPDRPVTVNRLPVGLHRSGLLDQSKVFSGFAARALRALRDKRYDVVVATSSRLLTGYLGALAAGRTGARLYLDVRDLFIENIREMFNMKARPLLPVLSLMERRAFERAARVNLVSAGFLSYYRQRFPDRDYSLFGNGIDTEFLEFDFTKPASEGRRTILYAGNLGLGQGLDEIVPQAARLAGSGYAFRIIGDGGRREALERRLREAGVTNATLLAPMGRDALKQEYRDADYLFLHLNSFPALERVLPSKVFEYAAAGKPILAGVAGHSREFIDEQVENAAVFAPGDARGMVAALEALTPGHTERREFKRRFARQHIMDRMAAEILGE